MSVCVYSHRTHLPKVKSDIRKWAKIRGNYAEILHTSPILPWNSPQHELFHDFINVPVTPCEAWNTPSELHSLCPCFYPHEHVSTYMKVYLYIQQKLILLKLWQYVNSTAEPSVCNVWNMFLCQPHGTLVRNAIIYHLCENVEAGLTSLNERFFFLLTGSQWKWWPERKEAENGE